MHGYTAPLRLRLDGDALVSNWRWLARESGTAACGAAIKADGYGLGATEVMRRLTQAGCRDFFVSNWGEAAELEPMLQQGVSLSVLHGVRTEDMAQALQSRARPVLSTPEQVARWRAAGGGACDVMIDTGMNRLGLDWRDDLSAMVAALDLVTLMSHLASADEDVALNAVQCARFSDIRQTIPARRYSLANSAGICRGPDWRFMAASRTRLRRTGSARWSRPRRRSCSGGGSSPGTASATTPLSRLSATMKWRS